MKSLCPTKASTKNEKKNPRGGRLGLSLVSVQLLNWTLGKLSPSRTRCVRGVTAVRITRRWAARPWLSGVVDAAPRGGGPYIMHTRHRLPTRHAPGTLSVGLLHKNVRFIRLAARGLMFFESNFAGIWSLADLESIRSLIVSCWSQQKEDAYQLLVLDDAQIHREAFFFIWINVMQLQSGEDRNVQIPLINRSSVNKY